MHGLLLKFNHTQPGFHRSCVMENILYIDAQIYESTLHAAFDCVSTVNNMLIYLINHLFVYAWAFTQIQSYSCVCAAANNYGVTSVVYWCSDLRIDVVRNIWLRFYCQQCVSILSQSSICVCMGFYSNSIIFNRVFTGLASWKISYILMLRSTNRCYTECLNAHLLSTMC